MSRIAVLNAGTATLKVAVLRVNRGAVTEEYRAQHEWAEAAGPGTVAAALARMSAPFDAVGHRVVHGGPIFREGVRLDGAVVDAIERLIPLAPLHNARALELIRAADRAFPDVPAFALFDTAFHAHRPVESMCYALPAELVEAFDLRRYGFHGIAHASLTETLAQTLGRPATEVTAVTLQLGSGCSACAVENGRSIETSMGYTPLEGLVMPSRSGDIDPAIVLRLVRAGYEPDEIERQLTRCSGLLGLAGSADVRELLAAEAGGNECARLALHVFVRRVVMTVGAYFTLLNGRGVLAFAGGIGTHSAEIRRRIAVGLAGWNIDIDAGRNVANTLGRISTRRSRDVFTLRTDEESIIAREVGRLLSSGDSGQRCGGSAH
ncbi:MAG TPA: acetate kinase [Gammaproteobacteria bacterium]|jgi:acetate kinase